MDREPNCLCGILFLARKVSQPYRERTVSRVKDVDQSLRFIFKHREEKGGVKLGDNKRRILEVREGISGCSQFS